MDLPPRPDADPTPRDGGWPVTLAVDPEDPIHRAFIRQELLRGTIRTIPDGPGRLRILPLPPRGLAGRRSPWGGCAGRGPPGPGPGREAGEAGEGLPPRS